MAPDSSLEARSGPAEARAKKPALVLGGGGARGAYQAGFLRGLAREFPQASFPIVTGVSAGAINAAQLASFAGHFNGATHRLVELWRALTVERVFRTDACDLASHMLRWGLRLVSGGAPLTPAIRGMVNSDPLDGFLRDAWHAPDGRLSTVAENLRRRRLTAVGITTTDYTTGEAVTWIQGDKLAAWNRPGRRSEVTTLRVEHILASASLPIFFPAVRIGSHWHGDGGVQLIAPFSPAICLGADRVLAISNRHAGPANAPTDAMDSEYPPPARIIGLLLRAVFLDMLDYDARVLERINRLLHDRPRIAGMDLRPIDLLLIRPSQDLSLLANEFENELPRAFRFALRGLGTPERRRPELLATLLFQPRYIARLIELGEADARARRGELASFLGAATPERRPVTRQIMPA